MSNFAVKTQVKAEEDIFLIEGRPFKDGRIIKTMEAIGSAFATGSLPVVTSGTQDGLIAYDSTRKCLVVSKDGSWIVA